MNGTAKPAIKGLWRKTELASSQVLIWQQDDPDRPSTVGAYYRAYAMAIVSPFIYVEALPVVRKTEKGVWVESEDRGVRFCRDGAKKRFAYPTREEAIESLLQRTLHRIGHLRNTIDRCRDVVEAIEEFQSVRSGGN